MKKFINGIPGGYNSTEPDYSGYKEIEPDYGPAQGIVRQAQDCVVAAYRKGYRQSNSDRGYRIAQEYSHGFDDGKVAGIKEAWEALRYLLLVPEEGGWKYEKLKEIFDDVCLDINAILIKYEGPELVEKILSYKDEDEHKNGNRVIFDDYNHTVCPHCNKQIDVDSDCGFCPKCGGAIKWPD